MAPTVQHILMSVHGQLPGGERWTCGLRSYQLANFLSVASGDALALNVANRWRVFANTCTSLFGGASAPVATVDGVTVREINTSGVTEVQHEAVPTTALGAGSLVQTMPNQCALAITLLTTRAGRTGKGRIYLPCIAMPATEYTGGVLLPSATNTVKAGFKILLDGINTDLATAAGTTLKLAVQSPTSAKKVFDDNSLADYNGAVITGFKVGNVIDTQRRRRTSVPEIYLTGVVA